MRNINYINILYNDNYNLRILIYKEFLRECELKYFISLRRSFFACDHVIEEIKLDYDLREKFISQKMMKMIILILYLLFKRI